MTQPAQTIIQLYNQLSTLSLSHEDQSLVRNAYDLGVRLFSDRHCCDGRPYVSHLTGTASIVAAQGGSVAHIAAALLHSAYVNGDFGDGLLNMATPERRAMVRGITGQSTEELILDTFRICQARGEEDGLLAAHRIDHEVARPSGEAIVFSDSDEDDERSFRIRPARFARRHSRGEIAEPLCGDRVTPVNGVPDSIGTIPFQRTERRAYAQTYPQLLDEVREQGYSSEAQRLITRTYQLAVEVFSGRFEQNGKVFLGHVVGAASLMASHGLDIDTVAAGLIHNIYRNGQFGGLRNGPVDRNRRYVSDRTSRACEDVVFGFYRYGFRPPEVNVQELSILPPAAKRALVVLLADQCEKLIGGEVLYHSDASSRLRSLRERLPFFKEMAHGIDAPYLYDELVELFESCQHASVPDGFRSRSQRRWSQVVAPASCLPRISVTTLDFLATKTRRALLAAKSMVQRGGSVHG